MNSRDKNQLPDYFIFHRREEEKRRLLQAWRTGSAGPCVCLPGRVRTEVGEHLCSLMRTRESTHYDN
jgi:hypothetical protein